MEIEGTYNPVPTPGLIVTALEGLRPMADVVHYAAGCPKTTCQKLDTSSVQKAVTLSDVSIRRKTLMYVRELWRGIKREFHICECNALLDRIYKGSIVIMWLVPPSASEMIAKPQPWSTIRFIQKEFIINIVLNDTCIYDEQVILLQCHIKWFYCDTRNIINAGQQEATRAVQRWWL